MKDSSEEIGHRNDSKLKNFAHFLRKREKKQKRLEPREILKKPTLKNMIKEIEVIYSEKKATRNSILIPMYLAIGSSLFIAPFMWFLIVMPGPNYLGSFIVIYVATNTLVIPLSIFIITTNTNKPYLLTRVLLTEKEFKLFLCNHLYLQFFWEDIEKIEIYWTYGRYKLKFHTNKGLNTIKLNLLVHYYGMQKKIVKPLITLAKDLNIELIEHNHYKASIQDQKRDLEEIRDFIKSIINSG